MATQNQIDANRRNAANSTGPTSPEGKAKSSMNALKTGIDAKSELIPFEDPEAHAALVAEYYDRFQPATPEERCLLDRMISSDWLHRRYSAVEGGIWELEYGNLNQPTLALAYLRGSEQLARVDRRLNSAQRNFDRAHKELRAVQEKRKDEPPQAETPAETPAETKPVTPELGSFLIRVDDASIQTPIEETSPGSAPHEVKKEPDFPRAA